MIRPISKTVSSMELARVQEISAMRRFHVLNDNEETPAIVTFYSEADDLWCSRCEAFDNCCHTARVRLCGCLTDSVTEDVRHSA